MTDRIAGVDAIYNNEVGDDSLPVRFTANKSGRTLQLSEGQKIRFIVNDDLTDLSYFRCMLQGYY